MQSLFAYSIGRDALRESLTEKIPEGIDPSDKEKVAAIRKAVNEGLTGSAVKEEDPSVLEPARQIEREYWDRLGRERDRLSRMLLEQTEGIYEQMMGMLSLAVALADMARSDRKVDHANFTNNPWIAALRVSKTLAGFWKTRKDPWAHQSDLLRSWMKEVLKASDEYMAYVVSKPDREAERKFAMLLFRKLFLGKTLISEYYGEHVLGWAEDRHVIRGMIEKMIKGYDPTRDEEIRIPSLSVTWEEDREFMTRLFDEGAALREEFRALIARNTRNWEVDRLPLTDRIILEMAVAEMVYFASIPVKVTINEYIELAKEYSTEKSWQFVNGILDVMSKELLNTGLIRKSGKGLIDNK